MIVEGHHYEPVAYGGQNTQGGGAAPIVCSCTSGTCAATAGGDAPSCRCGSLLRRPPCCCETLREAATVENQHIYNQQQPQREGEDGQLSQRYASSSRRCFCCVPEREELQECERLEKEHRYRSRRAERQQLQKALYNDMWSGEAPRCGHDPSHCYRPNTAHLLRYSQRSFYQRAVAMEQDRRRQDLRKEIEAKRRELSLRGSMRQPICGSMASDGAVRTVAICQPKRGRLVTRAPLVICGSENLQQHARHHHPGRAAPAPRGGDDCDSSSGRQQLRPRKHDKGTMAVMQRSSAIPAAGNDDSRAVKSAADPAAAAPCLSSRCRCGNGQEMKSPMSPQRCDCVCCRCKPCSCRCMKPGVAHSADVMAAIAQQSATAPSAPPKAVEKREVPVPRRAVSTMTTRRPASLSSRSHPIAVEYGRKIYITDDAYVERRSQVIERLERDGYLRCLNPSTRSPSAPLPEKTRRWTTTRSTSAHRV
ncbi:hypothetical protein DQ04_05661020 [Trypanosoma grayi]|uniref:hypothetical protein n=1 Tax=Trypanosoma grayi TaxID=71804 RepID=UPI0004F4356E|nr:hypothetical protein DQ04_05661020 [Trypanosoma grayi]KEG09180.1 hypothetical protein DQ04_05661020 [Trypanosoma grayi]